MGYLILKQEKGMKKHRDIKKNVSMEEHDDNLQAAYHWA